MTYNRYTRLLHLAVALGIIIQMVTSLVMVHPKPGRLGDGFYVIHETLGLVVMFVLAAHWLWMLAGYAGQPGLLFPWFSKNGYATLRDDARRYLAALAERRLPADDTPSPLAGALQGIGLLAGTVLAATGVVLWMAIVPDQRLSPNMRIVKEIHEMMGPVMWAFLAIHPTAGLIHELAGHGTLRRMFSLRGA